MNKPKPTAAEALKAFEDLVIEACLEGVAADHLLNPIRAYLTEAAKEQNCPDCGAEMIYECSGLVRNRTGGGPVCREPEYKE